MGGIFPSTISVESILAWQDVCAAEYRIEEDYLCIRIYDRIEKKSYLYMPLGMYSGESFQRLIDKLYGESRKDGEELLFRDVREEEIFWYRGLSGYRVRISSNEAYSDYIYRREELEQAFESRESATINDILSEITGHRSGIQRSWMFRPAGIS